MFVSNTKTSLLYNYCKLDIIESLRIKAVLMHLIYVIRLMNIYVLKQNMLQTILNWDMILME